MVDLPLQGDVKVPGLGHVPKRVAAGVVGGAAGFVLWRYWRASSATGEGDPNAIPDGTDSVDLGGGYGGGYGTGGGSYDSGGPAWMPVPGGATTLPSTIDPDTLPPATNAEWTQRVIDRLSGLGYDPMKVAAVMGAYLGRQEISDRGAEMIRAALAAVGTPPSGEYVIRHKSPKPPTVHLPVVNPKPKPTKLPAKKKATPPKKATAPNNGPRAAHKVVTVRKGNTLSAIASRYDITIAALRKLNPGLFDKAHRGGNLIRPGQKVTVK